MADSTGVTANFNPCLGSVAVEPCCNCSTWRCCEENLASQLLPETIRMRKSDSFMRYTCSPFLFGIHVILSINHAGLFLSLELLSEICFRVLTILYLNNLSS